VPDLHTLSLSQAADAIRTRRLSPVELTRHCLQRIERLDPALNAFITVTDDLAVAQARLAEQEILSGQYRGPLHGIPVALKDLLDVEGVRTTAASHVLDDNVAARDSEVAARLREAGAVFLGKTNLHEFAYGGSGLISAYGTARNPWDTDRITGGSSSGSAAAVAAGLCFMAIGTDTAGSIRLPAAYCGIAGLKPTHGLVSVDGVVTLSESLDHVGPLARTVEDLRLTMEVIADLEGERQAGVPRIGLVRDFFLDDAPPDIAGVWEEAIRELSREFRQPIAAIEIPLSNDRTLQKAESYQFHRQFLGERSRLYDPQTLQRIETGAAVTVPQIETLRAELARFRTASARVFDAVDIVATLTVPIEPARIAEIEASPELRARELLMLRNTRPFDVLGWPTITIPCGTNSSGLPVGLQLAADFRCERRLMDVAARCEKILGFAARPKLLKRPPELGTPRA